jgi:transcriptional regulator with XRE-family HTH domain
MNDNKRRQELAQFLRTRRERLSPEVAGLSVGSRRRTPGLRREELSLLAGIGVTWYTRLEQGQDIVVSPQVLESLAKVFDLNAAERHHLFVLAREQVPTDSYPLTSVISPQLQYILDGMGSPAYIINPRWDLMGWNLGMQRLFPNIFPFVDTLSMHERNILRAMFSNPLQRTLLNNWEKEARRVLALFRANADRYVREPWFKSLVAELQQTGPEFREWWAQHDIQSACVGPKEVLHPLLGRMNLQTNTFQAVDSVDLQMIILTAAEAETERKLIQLTSSPAIHLTSLSS